MNRYAGCRSSTCLLLTSGEIVHKGGEIRDTKTLNLSRNIASLQVLGRCLAFSHYVINLSRNKYFCSGSKKVVAKCRAQVYLEPITALHFFNSLQTF